MFPRMPLRLFGWVVLALVAVAFVALTIRQATATPGRQVDCGKKSNQGTLACYR